MWSRNRLWPCWLSPVSLPFLLDLHTEVTGSWKNPYSACVVTSAQLNYLNAEGLCNQGYVRMPQVEENLASPRPVLLSKPRQIALRLVGKACLEGLLEDLDQGEGLSPEAVKELCTCRAFRCVIRPSSLTTSGLFGTAIEWSSMALPLVKLIEARAQPTALWKLIPRLIWLLPLRLSTSTNGRLWSIYFLLKKGGETCKEVLNLLLRTCPLQAKWRSERGL